MKTGVGSLRLLQEIFPTQELNWVLLIISYERKKVKVSHTVVSDSL